MTGQTENESVPSAALRARIIANVAATPSRARKDFIRETAVLTIGSWALGIAILLCAGGERVTSRPLGLVIGTCIGTGLGTLALAAAVFSRQRSSLPPPPRVLLPLVVGAPLAILAWKFWWSSQFIGALEPWPTRPGFRCLEMGLIVGLAPLVAFVVSRRASVPVRAAVVGLAAGVAIGCACAFIADLWCPVSEIRHVLVGHMLPIPILGVLGAALGRRWLTSQRP